jgi:hypothetical protein
LAISPSALSGADARPRTIVVSAQAMLSGLLPGLPCSLFADTQSLSASDAAADGAQPESASNDVSIASPDAAIDSDDETSTPGDAGPTNLLKNGDFEDGCAFWQSNASSTTTAVAHSGSGACLVCSTLSDVVLEQRLPVGSPDPKGKSFVAGLWLRAAPDAAPPTGWSGVYEDVSLRSYEVDGSTTAVAHAYAPSLTSSWHYVSLGASVASGSGLILRLSAPARPGDCLIVDDAVLHE